ncbi:CaiB/BaiF CoA-transferase family protein [Variovorax sp. J31P207]|uniref:CaiB/BaiF CoA transferase family protein n=1 Tax=Variovorax sp. J31P207 TaxID=3053510 RepID=UPI0025792219|nr:CaiB/BaiF CoA-transferase family protein [Variovorax sp. J31P207]MDM0070607.1 CaiB/BaiF CoA-transferase family protein [Variovorax sp. J31P207]
MSGILSKIRVLDLSRVLSGPWAGQMLGDFGADVIKVERPGTGDDLRDQGARLKDLSGKETGERSTFLSTNRAKRSITIDLAKPEGQALVRELAAHSDVLLENYKTGDLKRYGLDYESLRELNPKLVYCSITGFGQTGPYSQLPGYDLLFQAMGGVMSLTGVPDGQPGAGPQRAGYPVSDLTSGFYATIGILAALHHRDTVSGRGQHIDLALLDAQVAATSSMAMSYLVAGQLPVRVGMGSQLVAPYGDFDCADGKIMIAASNDKQFAQLCKVLGRPELAREERFSSVPQRVANKQALLPIIADLFKDKPIAHWMPLLREAVVPAAPIYNFDQVYEDPQIRHRELVKSIPHPLSGTLRVVGNPLNFSETPLEYNRPPPLLGEHTAEILREVLSLDDAAIDRLAQQKVTAA